MLGQPVSMLIPKVVGFKLSGAIPTGVTATDVVLTITEMLRKHGVVGKFVEFYGEGVASVPLANRATIGNMSPEFGSTAAMFPIDDVTLDYLRLTGRSDEQVALVEAYAKAQTLWHDADARAGVQRVPRARPLDRRARRSPARSARRTASSCRTRRRSSRATSPTTPTSTHDLVDLEGSESFPASDPPGNSPDDEHSAHAAPPPQPRAAKGSKPTPVVAGGRREVHARPRRRHDRGDHVVHEHVEPVGHARRGPARPQRGQEGPQGQAVGQDHARARLEGRHRLLREGRPHAAISKTLGFYTVGYGCTTCIGNSGPLIEEVSAAVSRTTSPSPRCSRATATSRAASTPT